MVQVAEGCVVCAEGQNAVYHPVRWQEQKLGEDVEINEQDRYTGRKRR